MQKKTIEWHGRKYFLLGVDNGGIKHYLEKHHFDCGWYWGGGYVESFTNNSHPEKSRDIASHTHIDSLLNEGGKNWFDRFKELFPESVFTDKELWTFCELMRSFYTARHYSDMLHCGGAHYTTNPAADTIKSEDEYKRINENVIPAINDAIYNLLTV